MWGRAPEKWMNCKIQYITSVHETYDFLQVKLQVIEPRGNQSVHLFSYIYLSVYQKIAYVEHH